MGFDIRLWPSITLSSGIRQGSCTLLDTVHHWVARHLLWYARFLRCNFALFLFWCGGKGGGRIVQSLGNNQVCGHGDWCCGIDQAHVRGSRQHSTLDILSANWVSMGATMSTSGACRMTTISLYGRWMKPWMKMPPVRSTPEAKAKHYQ
jgi:hypothetical protein